MRGAFSLGAWATAESKDRLEQKLCGYRVVLQTLRGDDPGIDCTLLLAKGHLAEYVPQRSMALRPQEHCHLVRTIIHYTILCHIVKREGQIVGCFMISGGSGGEGGRGQNGGELAVKEGPAGAEEGVGLGRGGRGKLSGIGQNGLERRARTGQGVASRRGSRKCAQKRMSVNLWSNLGCKEED